MNWSLPEKRALRATFVMEQHLGHQTYYQNLRRFVDDCQDHELAPNWVEVSYRNSDSLWEHLPFLRRQVKGPLVGREQVLQGLNAPHEVAFFNTQIPAVLAAEKTYQKPFLLSTDITPCQYDQMGKYYNHAPDQNPVLSRFKHQVNRDLFQRAARLLPWSDWTARSLIQDYGVPPEKIEVIPPGIDLERWKPAQNQSHPVTIDSLPVRILFVGGDLYRKGGKVLLDAFRKLPKGLAELILVTRTPLPEEHNIRVYHQMQPNTREIITLYQSADIFVLPSFGEAFGIAAVEASAAGLPVIASAVGGLNDIVSHGETGFLVPAGEVLALADSLETLIRQPDVRQRMGAAARARAEALFDARHQARRVINLLFETVSGRKNS